MSRQRSDDSATIEALDPIGFRPHIAAAAAVYGIAMHRSPDVVASRHQAFASHTTNPGMIAAVATGPDGLIGFGYGYRSAPGQWWHETVAAALGSGSTDRWLAEGFELAELHVLPAHHGRGLGGRLLDDLLGRTDAATAVLSTPDRDSPARALYRSRGFTDLLTGFRFPGSTEPYVVMGTEIAERRGTAEEPSVAKRTGAVPGTATGSGP